MRPAPIPYSCRANMAHLLQLSSEYGTAHMRQSRPDSGLGFQVRVLIFFRTLFARKRTAESHVCCGIDSPIYVGCGRMHHRVDPEPQSAIINPEPALSVQRRACLTPFHTLSCLHGTVSDFGFRVGVPDFGFHACRLHRRICSEQFQVWGFGFRVEGGSGFEFRVAGCSGFRFRASS